MGGNTGFTTPQQDTQREIALPRFLAGDRLLRFVPVLIGYWWRTRQVRKIMGYAR